MGAMGVGAKALFSEIEVAVIAEIGRVGPAELDRAALVRGFAGRGAGRSTMFAWIDRILASGRPGQAITRTIKAAAAERAARSPAPAADAAAQAAALLPVRVTPDEAAGGGGLRILDKLAAVVADAEAVVRHAKREDGSPRNAKLLLAAGDALRRAMETCLKVTNAMHEIDAVDRFHGEIIDALRQESPELAARVVHRLMQINARWGAP